MANKSNAERVSFMTTTSQVVGSHLKTDLESYMTLIRRKVQEKCSTTHELITHIRRSKIGEGRFVTPNEFRFTLIKFGVIIAQPLVDAIFNVFDSDRSGSMDFDEFAMWIMNSEFKPVTAGPVAKTLAVDTDENLRQRFRISVTEFQPVYDQMKRKISYIEFMSELTKRNLKMTEAEARQIFLKFDPTNSGFIDTPTVLAWAKPERYAALAAPPPAAARKAPTLQGAINIVSGRNSKQMEKCFEHIELGAGIRIPFEEFRRCLVQSGLGKNSSDARDLFMALGGEQGTADIDMLLRACQKMHLPQDPKTAVTSKQAQPAYVSVGRAARHLRDAMRKSYLDVKAEILARDVTGSGFISAEELHQIMLRHCMPITFQDFRYVVQQLKTEDGGSKIDWHSFLHAFNPRRAPHQLASSASFADGSLVDFNAGTSSTENANQNNQTPADGHGGGSGRLRPLTATGSFSPVTSSKGRRGGAGRPEEDPPGKEALANVQNDLKKMWQAALKACHRADPERSGFVNRVAFISALESAHVDNTMSAEALNKLASEYSNSSGLVDYLCCFREFLNDVAASRFRTRFGSPSQSGRLPSTLHQSRDAGPMHPWEFDYHREKHSTPYWNQAAMLREVRTQPTRIVVPPPAEKSAAALSESQREALIQQYPAKVLTSCSKCYNAFLPMWKNLRNELQRCQIQTNRGSIIAEKFQAILEHFGVHLSSSEWGSLIRSFRSSGAHDVVKFDEFLRVCMIVKSSCV